MHYLFYLGLQIILALMIVLFIYMASLDTSKAFDRANHIKLFKH